MPSRFGYSATAYEANMASGSSWLIDSYTALDGLGRPQVQQHRQNTGGGSNTFDSVETDYDSVDRTTRVTMPYVTTGGGTNPGGPATFTTYDLLNRPLQTTQKDSNGIGLGNTQYTYYYGPNAYDVLATVGPSPGGQSRQFEYDGLGRLSSVCEVTSAAGSGACGQSQAQTGLLTTYVYTPLNKLQTVTQNAQLSQPRQTRSFIFDGLGRMLSESNPETKNQTNGHTTTTYTYDVTPTGCATGQTAVGDLATKADQNGNTISYCYDLMHRLVSVLYSGTNATHCQYFQYDSATVNSVAMTFAKGRIAEAYTTDCVHTSKIVDEGLSYNARGELTDIYESTPNSGGYYHVSATYWPHEALETLGGLPGLPTFTYTGLDGEGRVTQVQAGTQYLVNPASYNFSVGPKQPLGALAGITLGSGDKDTFQYDTNTGRETQSVFTVNNKTVTGNLTWNNSGTLSQLQITDQWNAANTQTCSYSYDDLARVSGVNCGTGNWQQNFYYASSGVQDGSVDAFGKITKGGSSSFLATYDTATNHFTLPGITVTYDNNGDLTYDGSHNYTWNAAGRPTAVDSLQLTYDAFNRLVETTNGSSHTQVVYAPTGAKLALMNGQTLVKGFVGLPGGATAVYNSSGLAYYRHADWLGSSRLASTPGGGAATPTLVQVNSATPQTNQSSVSVAFNNPQTAGNLNVVVVGWGDTTSSITSVSDSNNGGSSNGTASLVQKASNAACSSSSASCSMTVAATGTGHLLVVSAAWPGAFSIASVSGGGTWVCPAAAVGADSGSLGSAMCYVLSSTAGATTITVNSSAVPGGGWVVEFREYSPTATVSFDTAGNIADSTNCTSCSGVPLTLTGTNDLIVQFVNPTGTVTAVSSGWGNTDFPGPNYVGSADKIGTSSGTAPTWTTSSGHATGVALAFQLGTTGGGSAYTLAAGPNTGTGLSQAVYYLPNVKAGSNTITVTFNQPAAFVDIRVLEYSGVSTTTPFDVAAFGSGTINSGTTVSTANATTTAANELIVGGGITSWAYDAAGSGFTLDTITADESIAEHEAVTTAGSYNASAHAYGPTGTNWLMQMATFKAATTSGTTVYADVAYAPYGESYAQSGASDLSFTGQNNDTVSNLYDFLFREYHPVQGRWISPDPAGLAAVDPTNPGSWNRYAYVENSPLTATDANGLVTLPGCEEGDFGCGGGLDPGCGMWGGPEGDICTLLLPVIGRWGGGGGGSGSGGSGGGGGTDNGGSTGSGGGTGGSSGSGGRIANFPNGENLGLPPGVSANWGGILGAVLPIDPTCEFGTCIPIGEGFSPSSIPWVVGWGVRIGSWVDAAAGLLPSLLLVMRGDGTPGSVPQSVADLMARCTPGRLVSEPATGRKYQGGISYEQEYICSDGTWTVHWIVVDGEIVHGPHIRPGSPKGGGGA